MPIRVAIVEDHKDIRDMLAVLINGSEGFSCTEVFETAEEAIAAIPVCKPDVVLVDIHLPQRSGVECVSALKPLCPGTQFVMCTSLEDTETVFNALKAGANGYLTKSTPPAKLLEAIADVYRGGSPMSSQIARKVVGSFQSPGPANANGLEPLSKRETEILTCLSKGLRYKEIADKLCISIETVRSHIRSIYQKLQVNSSIEAINKAFGK